MAHTERRVQDERRTHLAGKAAFAGEEVERAKVAYTAAVKSRNGDAKVKALAALATASKKKRGLDQEVVGGRHEPGKEAMGALQAAVLTGKEDRPPTGIMDMARVQAMASDLRMGLPIPKAQRPLLPRDEKLQERILGAAEAGHKRNLARIVELEAAMPALVAHMVEVFALENLPEDPRGIVRYNASRRHKKAEAQLQRRHAVLKGTTVNCAKLRKERRTRKQVADEFYTATLFCGAAQVMDNGDRYEGGFDYMSFIRQGRGTMYFANGARYTGDWVDGVHHGVGEFVYAHGDVYRGTWKKGIKHGKGVLTHSRERCSYDGDFVEGLKHGRGEWKDLRSGEMYIGEWRDNERHGEGKMRLPTGDWYEGKFNMGERSGYGEWESALTGNRRRGIWKDGVLTLECSRLESLDGPNIGAAVAAELASGGGKGKRTGTGCGGCGKGGGKREQPNDERTRASLALAEDDPVALSRRGPTLRPPSSGDGDLDLNVSAAMVPSGPGLVAARGARRKAQVKLALPGTAHLGAAPTCPRCISAALSRLARSMSLDEAEALPFKPPACARLGALCELHKPQRRGAMKGGVLCLGEGENKKPRRYEYAY